MRVVCWWRIVSASSWMTSSLGLPAERLCATGHAWPSTVGYVGRWQLLRMGARGGSSEKTEATCFI